jgi:DNA polymerase elongation subunit (family B)
MSQKLEFQLYDCIEGQDTDNRFIIHSFGRCDDGRSVYAKITGFEPFFYVLIPEEILYKDTFISKLYNHLKKFAIKNEDIQKTLNRIELVQLKKAEGFTNDKLFMFAKLVFLNNYGMKKYADYLETNYIDFSKFIPSLRNPIKFRLYESNLSTMLRYFHIKNISGCSWVETLEYERIIDEDIKESLCNIEIHVDWNKLIPIRKDYNAPFRICSFNIKCNSQDGLFPQAGRDSVIQIAATYTLLGKSEPYRQYVGSLNDTLAIEGIDVKSFRTEQELLLNFLQEIKYNDCDIITGYNILYFDEKYLFDRSETLELNEQMSKMSKLKKYNCSFMNYQIVDNLLRFWNTPGRVHIDLMLDIQKDYKLRSYKLDNVASNFISGEIINIRNLRGNSYEIVCKDLDDIKIYDYINLKVDKGFISDEIGDKYQVINLNIRDKKIIIEGDRKLSSILDKMKLEGTLHWTLAKNDIKLTDHVLLFRGNSNDRAEIAKYSIRDCKLVSLLINKLEIVTKNIEMANVCYIPLSYLFIKGQAIKIFSLCLKEFMVNGYAFPVLKKSKKYLCSNCQLEYLDIWQCPRCRSRDRTEIPIEKVSFEGAVIFHPIPNVEYQAVTVKDYASLYPSSIIHKNMSHETIVEDPTYDNIPGIIYYDAEFKEKNTGEIVKKRFAKTDKIGILPKILDNLLKARKTVKDSMNSEEDSLKKKILDAKQLALKVTANSLFGQVGSSLSPVYKREIAACTTSTGREMLYLAKKYDEEYLPCMFNSLKHFYKEGRFDKVNYLLSLQTKKYNDETLINKVKKFLMTDIIDLTFQPIVRYGDTDSIFSSYRFREKSEILPKRDAMIIWKKVVAFGKELIEPYFISKTRPKSSDGTFHRIFNAYTEDKITDLELPEPPQIIGSKIDQSIQLFIKEYMYESYIPFLWTLTELVEKNKIDFFDIKINEWLKQKFGKYGLIPNNLNLEDKNNHYKAIIRFVNDHLMYRENKLGITFKKYYLIHPRWEFDISQSKKIHKFDIHRGGSLVTDKRTIDYGIKMGVLSGETIKSELPLPHDCKYEKTYWPFIPIFKKKYLGNKYEFDPEKYKLDYTGVGLKKRGDPPILKLIYTRIVEQLVNHRDHDGAINYLRNFLIDLINGRFDIKYFIISEILKPRDAFEDWTIIPHQVLANKIVERDPGNIPQIGDNIEYAFVKTQPSNRRKLIRDIIETPDEIMKKNLDIDDLYYINNIIKNPVLQLLESIDIEKQNIAKRIFDELTKLLETQQPNNKYYLIKNSSIQDTVDNYKNKYLKYKMKYLQLKSLLH